MNLKKRTVSKWLMQSYLLDLRKEYQAQGLGNKAIWLVFNSGQSLSVNWSDPNFSAVDCFSQPKRMTVGTVSAGLQHELIDFQSEFCDALYIHVPVLTILRLSKLNDGIDKQATAEKLMSKAVEINSRAQSQQLVA